jgi:hypothetical protein
MCGLTERHLSGQVMQPYLHLIVEEAVTGSINNRVLVH